MPNNNYLILLKNGKEALHWRLWTNQGQKHLANFGKMCAILDHSGKTVFSVSELVLPEQGSWVIAAYVKDNEEKKQLADKLKGKMYRIFFHGGSTNPGGGMEAIKKSFEENYGECGFTDDYMYFSSGSDFPANSFIDEVKSIFAESEKQDPL
jgi:hypothetical protein